MTMLASIDGYSPVLNNTDVGVRLGVSRAAVSRFRNGSRVPRMATQKKIAEIYGWTVAEQATAHAAGEWAAEFNAHLERAYPSA
jgi:transcriptional regulator with XRE-family HTH domain